jgi:hypothetical protein
MLKTLQSLLRPKPRIADAPAFAFLIGAESARIANKATIDYCRARTGIFWGALSSEPAFAASLDIARWEAFAAVLADAFVLAEGEVRAHVPGQEADLAEALIQAFIAEVGRWPVPSHRSDWADVLSTFPTRLRQAQLAAPKPGNVIAETGGQKIWDLLPLHELYKDLDHAVIKGNLGFQLLALAEQIRREVDLPAVGRSLVHAAVR